MADYFKKNQDHMNVRDRAIKNISKDQEGFFQSQLSGMKRSKMGKNQLELLDRIIEEESKLTNAGVNVFQRGDNLKAGLIDMQGVVNLIKSKEANSTANTELHKISKMSGSDSQQDGLPPKRLSSQQKWKKALKFMENNPSFLLDAIPSPRADVYTESMMEQKKQTMIKDHSSVLDSSFFQQSTLSNSSKLRSKLSKNLDIAK